MIAAPSEQYSQKGLLILVFGSILAALLSRAFRTISLPNAAMACNCWQDAAVSGLVVGFTVSDGWRDHGPVVHFCKCFSRAS